MDKFNITYVIEGIYGRVTFTKTIDEFKNSETLLKETIINEYGTELVNFWIECYEHGTDNFLGTTETIKGLPLGITEDLYFKMALLQNKQNIQVNIPTVDIKKEINDVFKTISTGLKN